MYLGVDVVQPLVVLSHGSGLAEGSVRIYAHAMLVLQGKWGSGSFPRTMPHIGAKMVVSLKKRTPIWPQYIITLIMGTPQIVPLILPPPLHFQHQQDGCSSIRDDGFFAAKEDMLAQT